MVPFCCVLVIEIPCDQESTDAEVDPRQPGVEIANELVRDGGPALADYPRDNQFAFCVHAEEKPLIAQLIALA